MDEKRQQLYIKLGFVGLSIIAACVTSALYNYTNRPNINPTQTTITDSVSGTTILNTDGKTPETYGRDPDAPAILGISVLHDRGMSQTETEGITGVLYDYASQQLSDGIQKIKQLSIDPNNITHIVDPGSHTSTYTINIVSDSGVRYIMTVASTTIMNELISLFKSGSTTPLIAVTKNQ